MLESFIRELDFPRAKQLLRQYNIEATDDEIRYLLPILKQNASSLQDAQKRSALIRTLPFLLQMKINTLLQRFGL